MQGSFTIHAQYIKDLSFENPKAPGSFQLKEAPGFNVGLDVEINRLDEEFFEVALSVEVKAEYNGESLFIISLDYGGIFKVEVEDKEELQKVLAVQCTQYLFPYVRQIISDTTQGGGYMPLYLHPVDFMGLYLQKTASIN